MELIGVLLISIVLLSSGASASNQTVNASSKIIDFDWIRSLLRYNASDKSQLEIIKNHLFNINPLLNKKNTQENRKPLKRLKAIPGLALQPKQSIQSDVQFDIEPEAELETQSTQKLELSTQSSTAPKLNLRSNPMRDVLSNPDAVWMIVLVQPPPQKPSQIQTRQISEGTPELGTNQEQKKKEPMQQLQVLDSTKDLDVELISELVAQLKTKLIESQPESKPVHQAATRSHDEQISERLLNQDVGDDLYSDILELLESKPGIARANGDATRKLARHVHTILTSRGKLNATVLVGIPSPHRHVDASQEVVYRFKHPFAHIVHQEEDN